MVGERALQDVVDGAQVVLVGHPGALPLAPAGSARPPWPRRRRSASSAVTGRVICHQVRTFSKPARSQPAGAAARRRRTRRCRSAGPRGPARPRSGGPPRRPRHSSDSATRSAEPRRRAPAVHDHGQQHPARGPVVGAGPAPDRAVRVAQHDVLAGQVARARRPRPAGRPRRRRPSRGRASRGGAAARSARWRPPRRGRRPTSRRAAGRRARPAGRLVAGSLPVEVTGHQCPVRRRARATWAAASAADRSGLAAAAAAASRWWRR